MAPTPIKVLDTNGNRILRVLITGFGPFGRYKENPSWLAVKPLHNKVLTFDPPAVSMHANEDILMAETDTPDPTKPRQIHITTCIVPVCYEDVLAIVPAFHARPPVLPDRQSLPVVPPPHDGYDLCIHIGVAGRGPLRVERLGHKKGYNMKDVNGKLASIVPVTIAPEEADRGPGASEPVPYVPSDAEKMELERLDHELEYDPFGRIIGESADGGGEIPTRGLGKGYEAFDDEIHTDIDTLKLVHFLKETGFEDIYTSMDAGHYLCDYIYYCSLAEAKRANRNEVGKSTKVLFIHCPPINQPHSTQEVTDALMKTVVWICKGLQSGEAYVGGHLPN